MSTRKPDEGRYSKVSRRVWGSADFRELSAPKPNAQTLWFRLLTGPELGVIPGLFEWSEAGTAERLGWPVPALRKCLSEVTSRGMVVFDKSAGVMWVPKGIRHNPPDNPNVVLGWKVAWRDIPECQVKLAAQDALTLWCIERGQPWVAEWAKVLGDLWVESIGRVGGDPFQAQPPQPSPRPSGNQEKENEHEKEKEDLPLPPTVVTRPPPADPMLATFGKNPPGKRPDVARVWEAFKVALNLPPKSKLGLGRPWDPEAQLVADAIDAYDEATCLMVVAEAPNDGMVNGAQDERGVKHDGVAYIFENPNTFKRLLRVAEGKRRRNSSVDVLSRAANAEPDLTNYRDPEVA